MLHGCLINDEIHDEEALKTLAEHLVDADVPVADCISAALKQPSIVLRKVVQGCIKTLFELEASKTENAVKPRSTPLSEDAKRERAIKKAEEIVNGISREQLAMRAKKEQKTEEQFRKEMIDRLVESYLKYEY